MSRYRVFWRLFQSPLLHGLNVPKLRKIPIKIGIPCTVGFSILTLIGLEKKLSAEDELILTIKHCVLFMQRNEYAKAEQLLHVALRQAQQIHHETGITYIYDVMANLALQREHLNEAKKLFVSVAQRIMANGANEDDIRVVQVSLKLARVSHLQKEYATAQIGYDWCLEKIKKAANDYPSEDLNKLLAMTEDWYGRLFVECGKYENGFDYMLRAYNRMKDMKDIDPEHIVVQLNDIGTVCDQMNRVDDCINYVSQAIDLGKNIPEMEDLGAMYVNLGRAYMKKKMLDAARRYCGQGFKLGVVNKNEDIKHEAEQCMKEIKKIV